MLNVLKADCVQELELGFAVIGRLLTESRRGQDSFEVAFPSLNGGCNLYPRLVGLYRDLWEATSIYMKVEGGCVNDCEAIMAIPGIAACQVLQDAPDSIAANWVSVDPGDSRQYYGLPWTPEEGGD